MALCVNVNTLEFIPERCESEKGIFFLKKGGIGNDREEDRGYIGG